MKTIGVIIISVFALLLVCSLANQAVVMKVRESEVISDKKSPLHFVSVIGSKVPWPTAPLSQKAYPFYGLLVFGAIGGALVMLSHRGRRRKVASDGPWDH